MLRQRRTDQVKKRSLQLLLISHDFAAVHESLVGTVRTSQDVRPSSEMRTKAASADKSEFIRSRPN